MTDQTTISPFYAGLLDAATAGHRDGAPVRVVLPGEGWREWWVASLGLGYLAGRFPRSRIALATPGQAAFCGWAPLD